MDGLEMIMLGEGGQMRHYFHVEFKKWYKRIIYKMKIDPQTQNINFR